MNDFPPSKSQRKRDMHEVQSLGETLVGVATDKLAGLGLPERLFDAIVEAKSISKHEARRRQIQYIGKLMRDIDPQPIREWLEARQRVPDAEKAQMALLETWRSRLLEEQDALTALQKQFPEIDVAAFSAKLAAVRTGKDTPTGKTAYRALFRDLKKLFAPDTNKEEQ